MSQKDNLKKLIKNHHRRLQILKEQEALHGLDVPPKILMEIEDIEAKIADLQKRLAEAEDVSQPESSPSAEIPPKFEFALPKRKPALRDFRRWLQGE